MSVREDKNQFGKDLEGIDKDLYKLILENAPDAFFLINSEKKLIAVNSKSVELTGFSRKELLSMSFADLFTAESLQLEPIKFDIIDQGESLICERGLRTKSGKLIRVETNSRAMPNGLYQSFLRDVTERNLHMERIRLNEERLSRAEIITKIGNWELHLDTWKLSASKGVMKIYGLNESTYDFSYIKTVPLSTYRNMLDKALEDLIERDIPYDVEFKCKTKDTGELKDIHSVAVFNKERRIIFGAILDISKQKRIEEELLKAKVKAEENDSLKIAFIKNLSHEVRTPMNAIMGFSELLQDVEDEPELRNRYSSIIRERAGDLLDIITNILDISMIDSGQQVIRSTKTPLAKLLSSVKKQVEKYQRRTNKEHIGFTLESTLDPSELFIVDIEKLSQILYNLLNNAFKFTREGRVSFHCDRVDRNIAFTITDTGMGIPADKQEMIFERFVQLKNESYTSEGGNGLGLSLAKELTRLLNGTLSLKSEPNKGSSFYLSIPFVQPQLSDETKFQKESQNLQPLQSKDILIVEDDIYNAEYLRDTLKNAGHNCFIAPTGEEALKLINEKTIDLILMDIRLPGIDGFETSQQIRKLNPKLKIIAQTAYATFNDRKKALDTGCVDYISKPIPKKMLLDLLMEHLA